MEQTLPPTEDQSELIAKLTRENEALRKENERLRGLKYATSSDIDREVQKLQSQRLDVISDRVSHLAAIVQANMMPEPILFRSVGEQENCAVPVAGPLGGAS